MLKSFFDRIFAACWAFEKISGGTGQAGLLSGRTAELITTMDTPAAVSRFLYRAPDRNAIWLSMVALSVILWFLLHPCGSRSDQRVPLSSILPVTEGSGPRGTH